MRLRQIRHLLISLSVLLAATYSLSQSTAEDWYKAGYAAEKNKNYATALADFKRSLQMDPQYANAWLWLGFTYSDQKQYEQARDTFLKYLTLPDQPDKGGALLFLGITYENLNQYEIAADTFRTLRRFTNDRGMSWKAQQELGHALAMHGSYAAAIDELQKAINLEVAACDASGACADSERVRSDLGFSFYRLQRYSEALAAFQEAARLKPDDSDDKYLLGMTYLRLGRRAEALAEYQELLSLDKNNAAELYAEIQKTGNAPASPPPKQNVPQPSAGKANASGDQCKSQVDAGDYANAIEVCKKAVATAPFNADAWSNLGMAYFGSKHHSEAAQAYEQVIRLRPNDAHAHYGIGAAYEEMQQYDKAVPQLREAVRLDASNASQWYDLGECLYLTGQFPAAQQALEKAASLQPNDSLTDYWLGRSYVKLGRQDQALAAYNRMIGPDGNAKPDLSQQLYAEINEADGGSGSAQPQAGTTAENHAKQMVDHDVATLNQDITARNWKHVDSEMFMLLLLVQSDQIAPYFKGANTQAVMALCDKLIAANPTDAQAYYWKAELMLAGTATTYDDQGRVKAPAGTAELLRKSLQVDPNSQVAEAAKGYLEKLSPEVGAQEASTYTKEQIGEIKKQGNAAGAQPKQTAGSVSDQSMTLTPANPRDAKGWMDLGTNYFTQKKFPEAIKSFEQVIRMEPNNARAHYGIGAAYEEMNQCDKGIPYLREAVQLDASNASQWYDLGRCLYEVGQYPAAEQALEKAANLEPNDSATDYWLGRTYVKLGQRDAALAAYNRMIGPDGNRQPDMARQLDSEINAAGGGRNIPRPADPRGKAATNATDAVATLLERCRSYYDAKDYAKAVEACKKTVELDRNNVPAYINWGASLNNMDRNADAIAVLRQAVQLDPNSADAWSWLGLDYFATAKLPEAADALEKAVRLAPSNTQIYEELGNCYYAMGRKSDALTVYHKLLATDRQAAEELHKFMSDIDDMQRKVKQQAN